MRKKFVLLFTVALLGSLLTGGKAEAALSAENLSISICNDAQTLRKTIIDRILYIKATLPCKRRFFMRKSSSFSQFSNIPSANSNIADPVYLFTIFTSSEIHIPIGMS
ncbi:MAG: hypothetical protein LBS00_07815 [Synergistaceae bacterium]|jgi:hypothetical protein|nr:hypothetical protein [Synergistaceae bacterium]